MIHEEEKILCTTNPYLTYSTNRFIGVSAILIVWPTTQYFNMPMCPCYRQQNSFPPVDTKGFEQSAKRFQELMKEVTLFINSIIQSTEYAYQLMDAAQKSDQVRVEQLIKSAGISIKYKLSFTPSAIQITFDNSTDNFSCCSMLVVLRW